MNNNELAIVIATTLFTLLYYVLFDRGFLGAQALHSFNKQSRQHWLEMILSHNGSEVLAIQVLRNSIMSSTVMASTCILLVIAAMSLASDPDKFAAHWLDAATVVGLWRIKVASLLLSIFIAFWHYAQAIRLFNHVGYIVGMPKNNEGAQSPLKNTAIALLNTAGRMYSTGNRTFFFSLALALWWFGLIYFIAGVAAVLLMSWWLEKRALVHHFAD